ncbi:peptide methionine sulfoxide reductase [Aureibaculum algae]|uniref:peptide-methionine (S)-S-oxide reductase n=1 Tax=Aureibaculum algae TaxID=2584122 RepID=A0A5B7TTM0_9FLAO|nr:peptide methionine sulfoxide reductase [Aureibaculum algae]
MNSLHKIGFGGGCHWCTEAVFQHLKGVVKVEQGWIASSGDSNSFSEAVIVHFDNEISLNVLTEIHLHTHKSTVHHSRRDKYRSAIYTFSTAQYEVSETILRNLQTRFESKIITEIVPFIAFKASRVQIQNYYITNPEKPFCKTFINPKLKLLLDKFSDYVKNKNMQLAD